MSDPITRLFAQFDNGIITRRQLLQALGVAAVGIPLSSRLIDAQGRCGGAAANGPGCDTTPAKPPFDSTGFRTVILDRFTLQVEDYQKEAAYYAALMNWKIRSDDGKQAVLDIGAIGSVVIRGGYVQAPRPAGTGGGGGGGGNAPALPEGCTSLSRPPLRGVWDSFTFGIEPWDTKKVESALKKRGLNPVPAHEGNDYQSFLVTTPDGFTVGVSNGNKRNRRNTPATGKTSAPAPFANTDFKTVYLDHISYSSPDYKAATAFYIALLGWTSSGDEGSQSSCEMGDAGGILIRGGGPPRPQDTTAAARAAAAAAPARKALINHISFGLEGFDYNHVKAELDKRCLTARADTGAPLTTNPIETARYKSYHTTTPAGWDLQISNTVTRGNGGGGGDR